MPYPLLAALLWLLACLATTVGLEQHDRTQQQQAQRSALQAQLSPRAAALGELLQRIAGHNQAIAAALAQAPDMPEAQLRRLADQAIAQEPQIVSVVLSRQLKAVLVQPQAGNEAILGLNYGLHPEYLASIKRADASRRTVFNAPIRMPQTGRWGAVARTAIFIGQDSRQSWGQVSIGMDLEQLLQASGLRDAAIGPLLALRRLTPAQPASALFGTQSLFEQAHASARIDLPDEQWELAAAPSASAYPGARAWGLRSLGLLLALLPLLAWTRYQRRQGLATPWALSQPDSSYARLGGAPAPRQQRRYRLRALLLLVMAVPVPLMVGLSAWLSLQTSMRTARELEQRQASEVALRLRDRVTAFFDVPRQMVTYNAEQFRAGLLQLQAPTQLQHNFLLQLRGQPWLTFLSVGTKDGAYYSASRPPLGQDRALRLIHTGTPGRSIDIQRVNDDYQPIGQAQRGNAHFDARQRPWFQAAVAANSIRWYPTYRYAIHDPEGLYDTLGLGMSTPLYGPEHQFLGVLTADVALSQLSEFLREQMAPLAGFAFVTEGSGELLACSDASSLYRLSQGRVERIRAQDSTSSAIRSAQVQRQEQASAQGQASLQVNGESYLAHWQTLQLPDGPTLSIVIALPQRHFDGPAQDMLRNMLLLTLAFWAGATLLAWWLAQRLAQPLHAISAWARELADGHWQAPPPLPSPVREITDLARALARMALHLRQHTQELERRVAERTTALQAANQQLAALAATDGLTGLANRRQFDQHLVQEVARAQRSGTPLALFMLDVDFFKGYNDRYGHPAGDSALQQLAALLRQSARRPGDLAARFGGEEFALIAASADAPAALAQAQALCQALAQQALAHADAPWGYLSVSIGVALLHAGQSPEALLQQADAALYQAKTEGRNRVVLAQ